MNYGLHLHVSRSMYTLLASLLLLFTVATEGMSICHYFKQGMDFQIQRNHCRKVLSSVAIASANRKAQRVIEATKKSTKRGPYTR